jgi:hypothetical protein
LQDRLKVFQRIDTGQTDVKVATAQRPHHQFVIGRVVFEMKDMHFCQTTLRLTLPTVAGDIQVKKLQCF